MEAFLHSEVEEKGSLSLSLSLSLTRRRPVINCQIEVMELEARTPGAEVIPPFSPRPFRVVDPYCGFSLSLSRVFFLFLLLSISRLLVAK